MAYGEFSSPLPAESDPQGFLHPGYPQPFCTFLGFILFDPFMETAAELYCMMG